jgi:hypothetical protein
MPILQTRGTILGALVLLVASPARADIDMTGRWFTATSFPSECHAVVQTGSQLDIQLCDGSGFAWTGTIDPASGAFTWERGSESRLEATVAGDGKTFSGTVYVPHCTFVGCGVLEFGFFGSRCLGGTVDPGEDCDDGPNPVGTCCTNECRFADVGTTCDGDADPTSAEACDAAGTCLAVPPPSCDPCLAWDPVGEVCVPDVRTACIRPVAPGARVSMSTTMPDARDALSFAWKRGGATTPADLGDPRDATGFELCVFAGDGARLLHAAVVSGGGTCGSRPCWSANGAPTTYRYRHPKGDGIRSMKLASGDATIRLGGKGAGLGLPVALDPAAPPVTVQLRRTDAPVCWEARFPVLEANTTSRLRARDGQ